MKKRILVLVGLLCTFIDSYGMNELQFRASQSVQCSVGNVSLDLGVCSRKHEKFRSNGKPKSPTNEDRFDIRMVDNICVGAAVYDGHGGDAVSSDADKELLSEYILPMVNRMRQGDDIAKILKDAFTDFDKKIGPKHIKQDAVNLMHKGEATSQGATASVVLVNSDDVAIAYVGDSRVIAYKEGAAGTENEGLALITHETEDHSATLKREKDRVTELERNGEKTAILNLGSGARLNGVLAVTRALGDYEISGKKMAGLSAEPDVARLKVKDCDFIVVASDGLWNSVSPSDDGRLMSGDDVGMIVNYLRQDHDINEDFLPGDTGKPVSADQIARTLVNYAGLSDDVTVMVILLNKNTNSTRSPVSSEGGLSSGFLE